MILRTLYDTEKFQVFVSSTYSDLIDERQEILKVILDLGHIPSGMEGFYAADEEQLSYIKKIIDECDYYVLVIAGRYGSTDNEGISYTEREYDYARSRGIVVLAFIHDDVGSLPSALVETEVDKKTKLEKFKTEVFTGRLISFWNNKEELTAKVIISLSKSFANYPAIGWIRGDNAASEDILAQVNSLRNTVESLREENSVLKSSLEPSIANIADLSSTFTVRYKHSSNNQDFRKTVDLSWKIIVKTICPALYAPHNPFIIKVCLESYISQQAGKYLTYFSIPQEDLNTIKVQLNAYGFINIYQAETKGGEVSEFISLTELGKRTVVELGTVRSL